MPRTAQRGACAAWGMQNATVSSPCARPLSTDTRAKVDMWRGRAVPGDDALSVVKKARL